MTEHPHPNDAIACVRKVRESWETVGVGPSDEAVGTAFAVCDAILTALDAADAVSEPTPPPLWTNYQVRTGAGEPLTPREPLLSDFEKRLAAAVERLQARNAAFEGAPRALCDALDENCGTATVPQERRNARALLAESTP